VTTKIYDENQTVFGNNTLGAKDMFEQRLAYQNIYPDAKYFADPAEAEGDSSNAMDKFLLDEDALDNITSPQPINFWTSKYSHYGRKDLNGNFLLVRENKLKQIRTAKENVYALNFVADAFEDFVEFVKAQRSNRLHPDDFLTGDIQAKRAWFNVRDSHKKITDNLYVSFVDNYLAENNLDQKIVDFETFLEVFINLYMSDMMPNYPISMMGFLESSLVPPNGSGLCVEMSMDDHGDDYNKFEKYINNANFEFYRLAAAKFGFLVDKNAPWRLVANLNSPAMRTYIQRQMFTINPSGIVGFPGWPNLPEELDKYWHAHSYEIDDNNNGSTVSTTDPTLVPPHTHEIVNGVFTIASVEGELDMIPHTHGFGWNKTYIYNATMNDIYDYFYEVPYDGDKSPISDVNQLKIYLVRIYRQFVRQYPTVRTIDVCPKDKANAGNYYTASSLRKTIHKTTFRKVLTRDRLMQNYSDLFWLKTYLKIRIKEKTSGTGKLDEKLDKVMSDINQLYYYVDKTSAIKYINQYLKQYY